MQRSTQSKQQIKLQAVAVGLSVIILAIKFAAFFITRSNAILTDALESIINVVAGGFALYSLYLSSKPRDYDHPYGHGKVEFISAGFEGGLIILAGVTIIGKSIYNFFYPSSLDHLDIGMALVVVTGALNYVLGSVLERKGEATHSLTLKADGRHLKSDAYSSVGLLLGLMAIYFTHIDNLDNIVAIGFGGFIIYSGIRLFRESLAGIMDEADTQLINQIIDILQVHRSPNWIDIHNMRVIKYGSVFHVDCHVTLPWYFELREAHAEMEKIAALVAEQLPNEVEFFIHPDPCLPTSCKLCMKTDCTVRQAPFEHKEVWTLQNVSANKKHGLE